MAFNSTTGIITIDHENETFDEILENIATCLKDYRVTEVAGIIARDIGLLCSSPNINLLSKFKPTNYQGWVPSEEYYKGDGAKDGYFLGYDCYGIAKPYIINTQFNALGPNGTPSGTAARILGVDFANLEGSWKHTDLSYFRLEDFDHYARNAKYNSWTNGTEPFTVICSGTNPNGKVAISATLRYNWEDILHEDGVAATLGLKSLLGCDGVNDQAYLGVAAFRTLDKSTGAGVILTDLAVAVIHTSPLGTACANTGEVNTHNVYGELDDVVVGYDGSISNGYTYFYIGETGVKVIPFIAKFQSSNSGWAFIGLDANLYAYTGGLVATGGTGSTTNNVVITKIVATLTCVKLSDGTIQFGLNGNDAFKVTITGSGDLAFKKNNIFYITPADGNSTMVNQIGIRLGISDNPELDLPVTKVTAGTYQASSIMYGRSSSATYQSAPNSIFRATSKFKVGFQVAYYRHLKTWTYLTGSVEVDPANLQSTYTITITGS